MDSHKSPITILLAEDDEDDYRILKKAFAHARLLNEIKRVKNGEELLDYLLLRGDYTDPNACPKPGLILLDLNMPKKDGREALKELRESPALDYIPVVVLTTSKAEEDIMRSYKSGANSFIRKPVKFETLIEIVQGIGKYWFEIVELPG